MPKRTSTTQHPDLVEWAADQMSTGTPKRSVQKQLNANHPELDNSTRDGIMTRAKHVLQKRKKTRGESRAAVARRPSEQTEADHENARQEVREADTLESSDEWKPPNQGSRSHEDAEAATKDGGDSQLGALVVAEGESEDKSIPYDHRQKVRSVPGVDRSDDKSTDSDFPQVDPSRWFRGMDQAYLGLAVIVGELTRRWTGGSLGDLGEWVPFGELLPGLTNGQVPRGRPAIGGNGVYRLDPSRVKTLLENVGLHPRRVLTDLADRGIILGGREHNTGVVWSKGRARRVVLLPDHYVLSRGDKKLGISLKPHRIPRHQARSGARMRRVARR